MKKKSTKKSKKVLTTLRGTIISRDLQVLNYGQTVEIYSAYKKDGLTLVRIKAHGDTAYHIIESTDVWPSALSECLVAKAEFMNSLGHRCF